MKLFRVVLVIFIFFGYFNLSFSQSTGVPWVDATLYGEFNVVLPENATPLVNQAVETFKRYWARCAKKDISTSPVNEGKINVWIGKDACSLEFMKNIERAELGKEGFFVYTYTPSKKYAEKGVGKHLVICVENDMGAVHGVYSFFENVCNARWYAEDCIVTPAFRIAIPHQNFSYIPPSEIRLFSSNQPRFKLDHEAKQALHLRFDISDDDMDWVDLDKVVPGDSLICLSDSEVYTNVKNKVRDLIFSDENRKFWVFRLPKSRKCECEKCKKAIEEKGSFTALYVSLFNDFFEQNRDSSFLENKVISISLSGDYLEPPKGANVDDRLYIELDTERCNLAKGIADVNSKENTEFARVLRGWRKLTDNVYVRYRLGLSYVNPLFPLPDIVYLQQNLQWFDQMGVIGVVFHIWGEREWVFSDWDLLKRYIFARVVWNPDVLMDSEIKDFLTNYYGKSAGEKLWEYFVYLSEYVRSRDIRCLYNSAERWWDRDFAVKYVSIVKSAFELVKGNENYRRRLLPVVLSANYVLLKSLSSEDDNEALIALARLREEVIDILGELEIIFGKEEIENYKVFLGF